MCRSSRIHRFSGLRSGAEKVLNVATQCELKPAAAILGHACESLRSASMPDR